MVENGLFACLNRAAMFVDTTIIITAVKNAHRRKIKGRL